MTTLSISIYHTTIKNTFIMRTFSPSYTKGPISYITCTEIKKEALTYVCMYTAFSYLIRSLGQVFGKCLSEMSVKAHNNKQRLLVCA